jgi:peroxiredoxin Q/BCP
MLGFCAFFIKTIALEIQEGKNTYQENYNNLFFQKGVIFMANLQEGQMAPDFTAQDEQGNTISLKDFRGKKNVILYFYPMDDTPGCTVEACNFRDDFPKYEGKETVIFGVSYDNADSHQAFKKKFALPFPLLVDTDKKIAQLFGVVGDKYANRDTLVIDKEGKIKKIFRKVDPKVHSGELLNLLGGK